MLPIAMETFTWGLLGLIYVVLLVVLGITSLRKGHWIMFIIGIFIPLFWIIGAVIPPVDKD
jgi:ATP/ADP translocase